MRELLLKMAGGEQSPPRAKAGEIFSAWVGSCLAIACIALMHVTKTLHPPGGATALIAVTGGEGIHQLGYLYAFVPCLLGALIMLAIALIVNNIPKAQRYPQFWW